MTRTEIIQSLIDLHCYKSYLEIGVQNGVNFNAVKCNNKVGVDPDMKSKATIFQPSDLFFTLNSETFDIIFIDGLHESEQVMSDLENAYVCLNKGGVIVVHDCNPEKEIHQRVPRESKIWNGDVWKAFIQFRSDDDFVIDTDCGVGIIWQGGGVHSADLLNGLDLVWTNFVQNKKRWLNLISVDEFKNKYINEQHRVPA